MAGRMGRDFLEQVRRRSEELVRQQQAMLEELFAPPKPRRHPQDLELLEGLREGSQKE